MDNNYLKAIYAAVEAGLEIMEVYTSNDFGVEANVITSYSIHYTKLYELLIMVWKYDIITIALG